MRIPTIALALSIGSILAFACAEQGDDLGPDIEERSAISPAASLYESKCNDDSDCYPGSVCEPSGPGCGVNTCVPGCHDDYDCSTGSSCTIVTCVTCPCPGYCESTGPVPCTDDSDCGPGTVCELEGPGCGPNSFCVDGCHDDADCSGTDSCTIVECITCPCAGICE